MKRGERLWSGLQRGRRFGRSMGAIGCRQCHRAVNLGRAGARRWPMKCIARRRDCRRLSDGKRPSGWRARSRRRRLAKRQSRGRIVVANIRCLRCDLRQSDFGGRCRGNRRRPFSSFGCRSVWHIGRGSFRRRRHFARRRGLSRLGATPCLASLCAATRTAAALEEPAGGCRVDHNKGDADRDNSQMNPITQPLHRRRSPGVRKVKSHAKLVFASRRASRLDRFCGTSKTRHNRI